MTLVATDPAEQASQFANVMASTARSTAAEEFTVNATDFGVEVLSPARYEQRFGALASPAQDRGSFFGALRVEVSDIASAARFAEMLPASTWSMSDAAGISSLLVRDESFDTVLEFVPALP